MTNLNFTHFKFLLERIMTLFYLIVDYKPQTLRSLYQIVFYMFAHLRNIKTKMK